MRLSREREFIVEIRLIMSKKYRIIYGLMPEGGGEIVPGDGDSLVLRGCTNEVMTCLSRKTLGDDECVRVGICGDMLVSRGDEEYRSVYCGKEPYRDRK